MKLTNDQLHAQIRIGLHESAVHLERAAFAFSELRERGADLSMYPTALHKILPLLAAGKLDPKVIVLCAWDSTILTRLAEMPIKDQYPLASGERKIVVYRPSGDAARPLPLLPRDEVCRAIKNGKIQTLPQQKAEYEKHHAERAAKVVRRELPLKPEAREQFQRQAWRQTFKALWSRASEADKKWARDKYLGKKA